MSSNCAISFWSQVSKCYPSSSSPLSQLQMPQLQQHSFLSAIPEASPDTPTPGASLAPHPTTDSAAAVIGACRIVSLIFIISFIISRTFLRPLSGTRPIPGPWSIPFLGTMLFVRQRWFETLSALRGKYGDIYQLTIGCRRVVVLCGRRAVERALLGQSKVFAGRPDLHSFRLASEGKSMSFNSYSPDWRVHRRLADRVIKSMYNDADFIDRCMRTEAGRFRDLLLSHADRRTPLDPGHDLLWSVAHVQYSLCYGDSHLDDSFHEMVVNTMKLIGCHNKGNLVDFFPWLPRFLIRDQEDALETICNRMLSITKSKHASHRQSYTRGRIRDALDALIEYGVQRRTRLDETQVVLTVQEFIGAGLDIVHAALQWAVLYLAVHKDVQAKVQEEIDQVVPTDRTVSKADMHLMPYTMAVISEVLRHSSVVPLALPHSTIKDTELDGFFIPSGTFVLVNLHSVNHDGDAWKHPEVFEPERFLEKTEDDAIRFTGDCVYGFGKRKCVGAELSRLEIFLYLTSILQSCMIDLAPEFQRRNILEPRLGIVLRPQPYSVVVTRRPQRHASSPRTLISPASASL